MNSREFISNITPFVRENVLVILLGCSGLLFLGYGLIGFFKSESPEPEIVISSGDGEGNTSARVTVDVSGAVNKPGVYTLPADARINEAIKEAGGLSSEADHLSVAKTINFAKPLADGEKIYIPVFSETGDSEVLAAETGKISINNATGTELDSLPGIGPVTTEKIIEGRPYSQLEDLLTKKVVGQSLFEKISDLISL